MASSFPALFLIASISVLGCAQDKGEIEQQRHEIERLTTETTLAQQELGQYRETVERLRAELKTQLDENAKLRDQLELLELEVSAKTSERCVEFVERVIEKPRLSSPSAQTRQTQAGLNPIDERTGLQVVHAAARATERNNNWWRWGWTLTVRNHSTETQNFKAQIQFMDNDGFVVDEKTEYNLSIGPGLQKTFTGSDLIDASVAGRVHSVNPILKR